MSDEFPLTRTRLPYGSRDGMTLRDTLWGDEKYHLVVTSYRSKITMDYDSVMVCVSMLNRDNGHLSVEMMTAEKWNKLVPAVKDALVSALHEAVQKMDALCMGENTDNDPRGHWCLLTCDYMTPEVKDEAK